MIPRYFPLCASPTLWIKVKCLMPVCTFSLNWHMAHWWEFSLVRVPLFPSLSREGGEEAEKAARGSTPVSRSHITSRKGAGPNGLMETVWFPLEHRIKTRHQNLYRESSSSRVGVRLAASYLFVKRWTAAAEKSQRMKMGRRENIYKTTAVSDTTHMLS